MRYSEATVLYTRHMLVSHVSLVMVFFSVKMVVYTSFMVNQI